MGIYETNLEALQQRYPDIHEKIQEYISKEDVCLGDSLSGKPFLAISRDEEIYLLTSMYDPEHAASRYVAQFTDLSHDAMLFQFGFGDGEALRQMMKRDHMFTEYVVYEPSFEVFQVVLEHMDIHEILLDERLKLFVEGANGDKFENKLRGFMTLRGWKLFHTGCLYHYDVLFPEINEKILHIYENAGLDKQGESETLILFAKSGMRNECETFRYMMNCRCVEQFVGQFPKDMPYILVAAGPSLEKNVEVLRQAKGKAFIMCVDTALRFLLERGIVPDMTCTIDAQKGTKYFTHPGIKGMPIAISTDSDYRSLDQIGEVNPIYVSANNDFTTRVFRDQGHHVGDFNGGGSVGTYGFTLGLALGFKTIIIIGQDLAFSENKAHAGMGKVTENDIFYNLMMVDAYDGGKIATRADFKSYLDWYNRLVPTLKDTHTIINATEGGAKIQGAIQMTLQEAVDQHCKELQPCDVGEIIAQIPMIWDTDEKRKQLYEEIKKLKRYFLDFRRRAKDTLSLAERGVTLLNRGSYTIKELKKIDDEINKLVVECGEAEGMIILIKRIIDTELTLSDDLHHADENLDKETIRLYEKVIMYFTRMIQAVDELEPMYEEVLDKINAEYHFE